VAIFRETGGYRESIALNPIETAPAAQRV